MKPVPVTPTGTRSCGLSSSPKTATAALTLGTVHPTPAYPTRSPTRRLASARLDGETLPMSETEPQGATKERLCACGLFTCERCSWVHGRPSKALAAPQGAPPDICGTCDGAGCPVCIGDRCSECLASPGAPHVSTCRAHERW